MAISSTHVEKGLKILPERNSNSNSTPASDKTKVEIDSEDTKTHHNNFTLLSVLYILLGSFFVMWSRIFSRKRDQNKNEDEDQERNTMPVTINSIANDTEELVNVVYDVDETIEARVLRQGVQDEPKPSQKKIISSTSNKFAKGDRSFFNNQAVSGVKRDNNSETSFMDNLKDEIGTVTSSLDNNTRNVHKTCQKENNLLKKIANNRNVQNVSPDKVYHRKRENCNTNGGSSLSSKSTSGIESEGEFTRSTVNSKKNPETKIIAEKTETTRKTSSGPATSSHRKKHVSTEKESTLFNNETVNETKSHENTQIQSKPLPSTNAPKATKKMLTMCRNRAQINSPALNNNKDNEYSFEQDDGNFNNNSVKISNSIDHKINSDKEKLEKKNKHYDSKEKISDAKMISNADAKKISHTNRQNSFTVKEPSRSCFDWSKPSKNKEKIFHTRSLRGTSTSFLKNNSNTEINAVKQSKFQKAINNIKTSLNTKTEPQSDAKKKDENNNQHTPSVNTSMSTGLDLSNRVVKDDKQKSKAKNTEVATSIPFKASTKLFRGIDPKKLEGVKMISDKHVLIENREYSLTFIRSAAPLSVYLAIKNALKSHSLPFAYEEKKNLIEEKNSINVRKNIEVESVSNQSLQTKSTNDTETSCSVTNNINNKENSLASDEPKLRKHHAYPNYFCINFMRARMNTLQKNSKPRNEIKQINTDNWVTMARKGMLRYYSTRGTVSFKPLKKYTLKAGKITQNIKPKVEKEFNSNSKQACRQWGANRKQRKALSKFKKNKTITSYKFFMGMEISQKYLKLINWDDKPFSNYERIHEFNKIVKEHIEESKKSKSQLSQDVLNMITLLRNMYRMEWAIHRKLPCKKPLGILKWKYHSFSHSRKYRKNKRIQKRIRSYVTKLSPGETLKSVTRMTEVHFRSLSSQTVDELPRLVKESGNIDAIQHHSRKIEKEIFSSKMKNADNSCHQHVQTDPIEPIRIFGALPCNMYGLSNRTKKEDRSSSPLHTRAPPPVDIMDYIGSRNKENQQLEKQDIDEGTKKGGKKVVRDRKKSKKKTKSADNEDGVDSPSSKTLKRNAWKAKFEKNRR